MNVPCVLCPTVPEAAGRGHRKYTGLRGSLAPHLDEVGGHEAEACRCVPSSGQQHRDGPFHTVRDLRPAQTVLGDKLHH